MQQWWQRARRDRLRVATANAGVIAVFVIGAYPFTGWRAVVAIIGVAASALIGALQLIEWRREGRYKPTTDGGPVTLDAALTAEIRSLVQSGRNTEAVRLVRERTGAGLLSASRTVDSVAPRNP